MSDKAELLIEGGVSLATLQPFIKLRWGEEVGQLSIAEARQHALAMLEACESAEQDAYLVWFMREQVKAPLEKVAMMLGEFRSKRGDFEKG